MQVIHDTTLLTIRQNSIPVVADLDDRPTVSIRSHRPIVDNMLADWEKPWRYSEFDKSTDRRQDATRPCGRGTGHDMVEKRSRSFEPSWPDPRNDRKTPYSDAELDRLTDDQIAMMADTAAWRDLVADVGTQRAREVVRERLAHRDPNSLVNWRPSGPVH